MGGKIVLGLSGGVDSSLAAGLLRQRGYEVHGLFLRYNNADPSPAVRAAEELGIELTVKDITAELEEKVISPFVDAYLSALTPNPCIMCNPRVKFRALIDEADRLGAEKIATGHYAIARGGRLYPSPGPKDQSYMLCRLPPEIISRCVFPLGEFEDKNEVRALARDMGLSSGDSPDSMEICFVPRGDYGDFIEKRGKSGKKGNFIDEEGNILAPNEGIHHYTVGQRRGLGVASTGRLYVTNIDSETGDVTLSLTDPKVIDVHIGDITFAAPEYSDNSGFRCLVRPRHMRGFLEGRCFPKEGLIRLDEPARVAPGQTAVCYSPGDKMLICAGVIMKQVII